jgi:hypothetical protein
MEFTNMKLAAALLLISTISLVAQNTRPIVPKHECVLSTCSASINIPYDDYGSADRRLGLVLWGTAGFISTPIHFEQVPPGYRVHITRVRGDFVAMMHGVVVNGTNAGVLWSLQTTSSQGSDTVEYGSTGCFEYIQGFVNAVDLRAPFSDSLDQWLDEDNQLWSKEAVWLNDTGLEIHAEITMIIDYQYVNEFAVRSSSAK